jgi:nucleotide-binding universal stress UspA family protein
MSIKNILCAYSGEATRGSAVRHAIKLARHHDAWITGVLRHGRPSVNRQFSAHLPAALVAQISEAGDAKANEIETRFMGMVAEAGLSDRAEFVDLNPDVDGAVSEFARHFDLVVTGSRSEDRSEEAFAAHPDLIALRSGRPVLVVPNGYDAPGLADHALVAWDGKRSSARAIGDAMPYLEEKAKVTILTVGRKELPDTDRMTIHLQRHGIDGNYILRPRDGSVAGTIQSVANELGAKLIVMGAFEHSRFTHSVMGGVTTDVIRDTRVPVFLTH